MSEQRRELPGLSEPAGIALQSAHDTLPSGTRYNSFSGVEPQLVHVLELAADSPPGERAREQVSRLVRLSHPHIDALQRTATTDDGRLAIIGSRPSPGSRPLQARARTAALDLRQVLHVLRQIAETLDELHGEGLVHGTLDAEGALRLGSWRGQTDCFVHIDWGHAAACSGGEPPEPHDDVHAVIGVALELLAGLDSDEASARDTLVEHLRELEARAARATELLAALTATEQAVLDSEPAVSTTWTLDMVEAEPGPVQFEQIVRHIPPPGNPKGTPEWERRRRDRADPFALDSVPRRRRRAIVIGIVAAVATAAATITHLLLN